MRTWPVKRRTAWLPDTLPATAGRRRGAVFIRALDLIDFDYGSAPGLNDWWHTEKDTMDKVSEKSLLTAGRLCLAVLGQFRNE